VLGGDPRFGGRPHRVEEAAHRFGRFCHGVGEPVMRVARVSEELGACRAERDGFGDQRAIVRCPAELAAPGPGLEGFLAQVTAGREGEEGLDRGAAERDDVLAGMAALLGRRRGGAQQPVGEAGAIVRRLEHERPAALVGEDVLGEGGADRRQPFVDGRELLLIGVVERGARPDENRVVAVRDARFLLPEARPAGPYGCYAAIEFGVEGDPVGVAREERRDLALDRLQRLVGVRAGEVEERRAHALEGYPRELERHDGVLKAWRLGRGDDFVDRPELVRHLRLEGGPEVLGLHHPEGRQAERIGP
jgi:hypothetical protein